MQKEIFDLEPMGDKLLTSVSGVGASNATKINAAFGSITKAMELYGFWLSCTVTNADEQQALAERQEIITIATAKGKKVDWKNFFRSGKLIAFEKMFAAYECDIPRNNIMDIHINFSEWNKMFG